MTEKEEGFQAQPTACAETQSCERQWCREQTESGATRTVTRQAEHRQAVKGHEKGFELSPTGSKQENFIQKYNLWTAGRRDGRKMKTERLI